jgi:hypothetical protein
MIHKDNKYVLAAFCLKYVSVFSQKKRASSSVSIVHGYGMDDRAIEVRFPADAKDFSSNLCVQTGSGAHPASWTMGTVGSFLGAKARPGCDADHSPPSSAECRVKNLFYPVPKLVS